MTVSEDLFAEEIARAAAQTGTDVVPLSPEPGESLSRGFRPNGPIVTQLWAEKLDVPQARARRRTVDAEGAAAYGATGAAIVQGRRKTGPSWAA